LSPSAVIVVVGGVTPIVGITVTVIVGSADAEA
jgi:hypothetical protein